MRSSVLRSASLACLLLGFSFGARAQTKISGTMECAAPKPMYSVPIAGMKNHSFILMQSKCTWPKPIEIAGVATKSGVDTSTVEIAGSRSRERGYSISAMTNGDLLRVRYFGAVMLKAGAPVSERGRWTFLPSTGKLRAIRGRGTYQCRQTGESTTCDIVGQYRMATPKRRVSSARRSGR